jgi:hypothetical protein
LTSWSPWWSQDQTAAVQAAHSGKSAERAVASAGVTYDREILGGFVTTFLIMP